MYRRLPRPRSERSLEPSLSRPLPALQWTWRTTLLTASAVFASLWVIGANAGQQTSPAPAPEALPADVISAGDIAATGFSGIKLQVEGLKPGVDPVSKTVLDPEGITLRIYGVQSIDGPMTGQMLAPAIKRAFKARTVGHVFGLAVDNAPANGPATPGLYAGATSAFGLHIVGPDKDGDGQPDRLKQGAPGAKFADGQFGGSLDATPGSIWKIDRATGVASLFANVGTGGIRNSGPGIGGLAVDPMSRTLYASDLDTGLIHRLNVADPAAQLTPFDHGVTGRPSSGKPAVKDDGTRLDIASPGFDSTKPESWAITPLERRIDGLAVQNGRLYYAVAEGPEIWSVGLEADGAFKADARFEVVIKSELPFPVTSIVFDRDGQLIVAQRGFAQNTFDYGQFVAPGATQVLRYAAETPDDPATPALWKSDPQEYAVSGAKDHRGSDGGLAIQYSYRPDGSLDTAACGGTVIVSADALGPKLGGYGLQLSDIGLVRPANAPPTQSAFIALDPNVEDPAARGYAGGVAAFQDCSGGGAGGFPPVAGGGGDGFPPVAGGGGGQTFPPVTDNVEGGGGGKVIDPIEGGGGGKQKGPVIVSKKGVGICKAKGPCAFTISVQNVSNVDVPGEFVLSEQIDAPLAKLAGEPNAPWKCTPAAPFECRHPGPLPANSTTELNLAFIPNTPLEKLDLKNCAVPVTGGGGGKAEPGPPAFDGPAPPAPNAPAPPAPEAPPPPAPAPAPPAPQAPPAPAPAPALPDPDQPKLGVPPLDKDVEAPFGGNKLIQFANISESLPGTPRYQSLNPGLLHLAGIGGPAPDDCVNWETERGFRVEQSNGFFVVFTDIVKGPNNTVSGKASWTSNNFEKSMSGTFTGILTEGGVTNLNVAWRDGSKAVYQGALGKDGTFSGSTTSGSGVKANLNGDKRWWKCVANTRCSDYSRAAKEAADEFASFKCGTSLGRWTPNARAHADFCMGQPANSPALKSETDARTAELAACLETDAQCTQLGKDMAAVNDELKALKCDRAVTSNTETTGPDAFKKLCRAQKPQQAAVTKSKMESDLAACKVEKANLNETLCGDFAREMAITFGEISKLDCAAKAGIPANLDENAIKQECMTKTPLASQDELQKLKLPMRETVSKCRAEVAAKGGGAGGAGGGAAAEPAPEQCAVVAIEPDGGPVQPPPAQASVAGKLSLVKTPNSCDPARFLCVFDLTVTNTGDTEFKGAVQFDDAVTADGTAIALERTTVNGQPSPWTCPVGGPGFNCSAELTIPAKSSAPAVQIFTHFDPKMAAKEIKNCATLKGAAAPSCVTIPFQAPVEPPPPVQQAGSLTITKVKKAETCSNAGGCAFEIRVRNDGNAPFKGQIEITEEAKIDGAFIGTVEIEGTPTNPFTCTKGAFGFSCKTPPDQFLGPQADLQLLLSFKPGNVGAAKAIENCATIAGTANKACATIPIGPPPEPPIVVGPAPKTLAPNLRVIKTLAPNSFSGPCTVTRRCTFHISVGNAGNATFEGPIVLHDDVQERPPGLMEMLPKAGSGWSCTGIDNSTSLACSHPVTKLAPGEGVSLQVAVTPGPNWKKNDTLTNCALLAFSFGGGGDHLKPGNDPGKVTDDDKSCKAVKLDPFAVKVAKTGDSACAPGSDCNFKISLFNPGPIDHRAPVTITDKLTGLSSAQIVSITPANAADPFPCIPAPTQIPFSCTSPGNYPLLLGPNGEPMPPKEFNMVVRLPNDASAAQFSNCAGVGVDAGSPAAVEACHTVSLKPVALSITKTATSASCDESTPCTFKIKVANTGAQPYAGPIAIDEIPRVGQTPLTQFKLISATAPWSCIASAAPGMQCSHPGPIPAGGAIDLDLSLQPLPGSLTGATEIRNCAALAGTSTAEPRACATIPVKAPAAATPPPGGCSGGMVMGANGLCACPGPTKFNGRECVGTGGFYTNKPGDENPANPPPVATPGQPTPASCSASMVLTGGLCACPPGAKWNGRECVGTGGGISTTKPGDDSPKAQPQSPQCPDGFVGTQGRCCPRGTEFRDGACRGPQAPNSTPPTTCPEGFVSSQGRCCPRGTQFRDGACRGPQAPAKVEKSRPKVCPPNLPVGEYPNCCPANSRFRNGECQCRTGTTGVPPVCCSRDQRYSNGKCVPREQPKPEPKPQPQPQQKCPNSAPEGTWPNCHCPAGTVSRDGFCRPATCPPNMTGVPPNCNRVCPAGTVNQNQSCVPVQKPDPVGPAPKPVPQKPEKKPCPKGWDGDFFPNCSKPPS